MTRMIVGAAVVLMAASSACSDAVSRCSFPAPESKQVAVGTTQRVRVGGSGGATYLDFDARYWSPPVGLGLGTDAEMTLVAEQTPEMSAKASVTLPDGTTKEVSLFGCA